MDVKKVSYDDISNTLKTGDLILLSGQLFTSELTQLLQVSKWSHVAMVIHPKDIGIDYNRPVLWESNTLQNLEDIALKTSKVGPMLVDLQERIYTDKALQYDDLFQIRYLNQGMFDEKTLHGKLKAFIEKSHTAGYPNSELRMFKDVFDGLFNNKDPEPSKYFCSELIADTYIHMGLLPKNYVPNSYMPRDFSDQNTLPLLGRAMLHNGPFFEVTKP